MTGSPRNRKIKLAFETTSLRIPLGDIEMLRAMTPAIKKSIKYGQIEASIREVGIIESACAELSEYRARHEAFRALLCHGVAKVSVDHSGQWILLIRSLSIRARQAERGTLVMEQGEANTVLAKLKRDGQNLASVLGQLRKKVSS